MKKIVKFTFILLFAVLITISAVIWPVYIFWIFITLIFSIGLYDITQKKHTILRNFPIIGHLRYLFEDIAPEIHQYFIESDTDGKPIDRNHRTYVYQRAKLQNHAHPYGTELNVDEEYYKWMQHSIYPSNRLETPPKIIIGGQECKQPYSASLFNISAMSFGALSKNAIMSLNLGAKSGNFFHDTGEGGISEYHLNGGDLVYEIGTGYFGCRDSVGNFSPEKYKALASLPTVKMIAIKLSQGAKPGHGGVLPAIKNTNEIAKIRGIEPFTTIHSPPRHTAFNDAKSLLDFIQQLRELSNGKPIGFKLCIGSKHEFIELCEQMVKTKIKPDFITIDGSEGGTGAAPIDFSNYVGMPWEKGLIFAVDTLNGFNLKKDIKIITATKIFTAFDIFKALCIGADVCSSARGMMLALGCIQSLRCHTNTCPTGITTHKPNLVRGLVVEEKWHRVKNYQQETLKDFLNLFAAAGCSRLEQLNRTLIFKQINDVSKSYAELYPEVQPGSYLP